VPLAAWFRVLEAGDFAESSSIKRTFGAADYLAPYTIFDVGGNKYRVITVIHYKRQCVYVRHVLTHSEYDDWTRRMRSANRSKRQ
jgi:mRNA interferase HigB